MIIFIYIFKKTLMLIYLFMKFLPTKNKIVFISRQSNSITLDFNLIAKEIKNRDENIKIVFICKRLEKTIKGYIIFSFVILKQIYQLATSKICILDSYCIPVSILNHKKELFVLQIWHSIGKIKKSGYQTIDNRKSKNWLDFENKISIVKQMNMHKNYDKIIAGGEAFNNFYIESFNVPPDKILNYGLPRIDHLINNEKITRKKIYEKYPEFKNKKIIFYAPTFRQYQNDGIFKLLERFNGSKDIFIVRSHPNQKIDFTNYNVYNIKDFSGADLITICDYLITDYSSICLDAAIISRKLIFYVPDYKRYMKSNGLNLDPKIAMPNCTFDNANEVYNVIKSGKYNYQDLNKFRREYLPHNLGKSTQSIVDYIMKQMELIK